jgi:hypothetical protein
MRSWIVRILLVLLGLFVVLVGFVVWAVEDEYGSGTNFLVEHREDGHAIVYAVDEPGGQAPVFEGTTSQAQAYVEQQQAGGKNFLVPGLIIAAGAILVVAAVLWPRRRRREPSTASQDPRG